MADREGATTLRERQKELLVRLLTEAQRPCTSAELAASLALPDGRTVAWHLRHLAAEKRVRAFKVGGIRVYSVRKAERV